MAGWPPLPQSDPRYIDGSEIASLKAGKIRTGTMAAQRLTIKGGSVQILDSDGTEIAVLDGSRLLFNNSSATRILEITPSGGLKIYTGGSTEKVVLDSSGLEVDGGNVQAVWVDTGDKVVSDASLTTTPTDLITLTIDPPSWVEQLFILGIGRASFVFNNSGASFRVEMYVRLDHGGASQETASALQTIPNGETGHLSAAEALTVPLSPAGRTVDCTLGASVTAGSNSSNVFGLKVLVFGVRSAFT